MPSHAQRAGPRGPVRNRRGSGRGQGRKAHVYAALDLGTNNCRLLVARPTPDGFRVIDAFSRIVRLGEGLGESGCLREEAMRRTIDALRVCAAKIRRRSVTRVRSVATEACRRASNGNDFLSRVSAETGIKLDIISPREEALLALAGCASLLDRERRRALLFDIGGGSTEVTLLDVVDGGKPDIHAVTSLPCGVVSFAERYGGRDVSRATYEAMVGEVRSLLAPFEAAHGFSRQIAAGQAQMLGTSGTVTTLAAVNLDLPKYDRSRIDGTWLDIEHVTATSRRLSDMSYDERVRHPCIKRERADLVVAGCAILEGITRTWPVPRLRVADRGLREGILLALMSAADSEAAA